MQLSEELQKIWLETWAEVVGDEDTIPTKKQLSVLFDLLKQKLGNRKLIFTMRDGEEGNLDREGLSYFMGSLMLRIPMEQRNEQRSKSLEDTI